MVKGIALVCVQVFMRIEVCRGVDNIDNGGGPIAGKDAWPE